MTATVFIAHWVSMLSSIICLQRKQIQSLAEYALEWLWEWDTCAAEQGYFCVDCCDSLLSSLVLFVCFPMVVFLVATAYTEIVHVLNFYQCGHLMLWAVIQAWESARFSPWSYSIFHVLTKNWEISYHFTPFTDKLLHVVLNSCK